MYFVCYLPPEGSPYSRDIDAFYAHLITELYLANEADMIFLAGDFNARIGSNTDTFDGLDDTIIPERKVLDLTSNKHGSMLFKSKIIKGKRTTKKNKSHFYSYICIN